MVQVYVTLRRADIPAGTLVVRDLTPQAFRRSPSLDPRAQGPYYVRPVQTQTVVTSTVSNVVTTASVATGLAAYLISHVEAAGLGVPAGALTSAQADSIAAALIASMRAGNDLNLSSVDTVISGVVPDTELTNDGGSNSTGSLADLLAILAGKTFTLPAGTVVQSALNTFAGMNATTTAANFDDGTWRRLYATDAFMISLAEGNLAYYLSPDFSYKGVAGAAIGIYDVEGDLVDFD